MKEFVKLDKYGQLYIDRVLFESYFPIIFTCKNDDGKIFICVCCQNNKMGCKWLVGKTDGISIVKMLKDKITIRELLLAFSEEKISVNYVNDEYTVEYNNQDWSENSIYLPKEDSYMLVEKGEFDDDISYFSSVDCVRYNAEYYKKISNVLETIDGMVESVADTLNVFASAIENITITIPSEMISTLEVFGKLGISLSETIEEYVDKEKYKLAFSDSFKMSTSDLGIKIEDDGNSLPDAA